MTLFVVELYVSRTDAGAPQRWAEDARRAAEELTRAGTIVRYQRSIFLPEDETCFYLYEAESAGAVREAAQRARLPFERVVAALMQADAEEAR